MITQRINLNLIPGGVLPRINVSQYDTGSRTLELVLYNGDTAYNVPTGSSVYVVGTKADKTGFEYSCTYDDNVVSVDITDQMTVFGGEVMTEIRILKDGDQIGTGNFIINVEPTALADDTIISETDLPIIQNLPTLVAEAEASAELAHAWADYGDDSETPSATNNAKYWSIQAAAAAAGCLRPEVVATLPTSDISTVTLYFVPSSDPETGNLYDEYINTDGTSAGWELIGSTGVDLTNYLQKSDVVDNLNSNDGTVPLSARMGKVLSQMSSQTIKVDYVGATTTKAYAEDAVIYYNNKFYKVIKTGGLPANYTIVPATDLDDADLDENTMVTIVGMPASAGLDAIDVNYDNTTSGLSVTKVQGAIDEINSDLSELKDTQEVTLLTTDSFTDIASKIIAAVDLSKVTPNTKVMIGTYCFYTFAFDSNGWALNMINLNSTNSLEGVTLFLSKTGTQSVRTAGGYSPSTAMGISKAVIHYNL